ncbi:MAG TPA: hypothetical protein VJZ71_21500 [Phycisphaerae bacterium]|nr:hypothetical protein [Phycisphaerae bacterium]
MKNSLKLQPIELLALALVACTLLAVLTPGLFAHPHGHPGELVTQCAAHLRGIGQAMYIYAQDDPGVFPALALVRTENDGLMQIFDPLDRVAEPSTTGIPSPTVDMWALVRIMNVAPETFICPFTADEPDPAPPFVQDYYDFLGPKNLSYAYQYQHDPNRPIIGTSSEPTFPLMADANPYIKGGVQSDLLQDRLSKKAGNSDNHKHRRDGQNVLYQDSHVDLEASPAVGLFGMTDPSLDSYYDNIYTVHEDGGLVDPGIAAPTPEWCNLGSRSDACLVP